MNCIKKKEADGKKKEMFVTYPKIKLSSTHFLMRGQI